MGKLVTSEVSALRLVFAVTDRGGVFCHNCLDAEWEIPLPGYRKESKFQTLINVWTDSAGDDNFLNPSNWSSYPETRSVDVYCIEESNKRSLAKEIRSTGCFDRWKGIGLSCECISCGKRLVSTVEQVERECLIEFHGVKIF